MKKIIEGKVYNTETAEFIGSWNNGKFQNDFGYIAEELYRKKTGEFFLYGEGGPQTKYVNCAGGVFSAGEQIVILSFLEAKKWAETKLTVEVYEKIFGEIEEDETKKNVLFSLKTENIEKLKRLATELKMSMSAIIDNFIEKC